MIFIALLYLIEILHQTTTFVRVEFDELSCILSKFYIKPQQIEASIIPTGSCILSKFYIKPQLILAKRDRRSRCILSKFYIKPQRFYAFVRCLRCCILSKFYIKPQQSVFFLLLLSGCILSKFYIKPQLIRSSVRRSSSCILSKFYIKPQLRYETSVFPIVVSYRNSTSNHNPYCCCLLRSGVVSYRNSTSNHNLYPVRIDFIKLYLIEILHQTTTQAMATRLRLSCILSKFYIKPQLPTKPV